MVFCYEKERKKTGRNDLLFGLVNTAVIFRKKKSGKLSENSLDYDVVCVCDDFKLSSPNDFTVILFDYIRCGKIDLADGDVVGVRANGMLECYRYFSSTGFTKIIGFTDKERGQFVSRLHKNNKVLSILDKKELPLSKLFEEGYTVFAIEGESYRSSLDSNREVINTYYCIYKMDNGIISKVNPYDIPFCALDNAMNHFIKKWCSDNNKNVLLSSRKELYRIKDYVQLNENLVMA